VVDAIHDESRLRILLKAAIQSASLEEFAGVVWGTGHKKHRSQWSVVSGQNPPAAHRRFPPSIPLPTSHWL